MMEIACPSCGKRFMTEERFAGRTAKCPACSTPIQIPASAPTSPAASPSSATPPDVPAQSSSPPAVPQAKAPQPKKLKTAGILSLAGGIWAVIASVLQVVLLVMFVLGTLGFGIIGAVVAAPFVLYTFAMGVVAIVNGAMVLNGKIRRKGLPMTACIMQIVNVISCDIVNLILGIIALTNLRDPEVKAYFGQS